MPSPEIVLKFLGLHWFSRLWIIQEVVHNVDVVLYYGKGNTLGMHWAEFSTSLSSWCDYTVEVLDPTTRNDIAHKTKAIKRIYQLWAEHSGIMNPISITDFEDDKHKSLGIIGLMTEFAAYGCADDRDRIFAMYSMAKDIFPGGEGEVVPGSIALTVDYSGSVLETFQRFAINAMRSGFASKILHGAAVRKPLSEGWPSWMPHWTVPITIAPLRHPLDENIFRLTAIEESKIQLSPTVFSSSESHKESSTTFPFQPKQLKIIVKAPLWNSLKLEDFIGSIEEFIAPFLGTSNRFLGSSNYMTLITGRAMLFRGRDVSNWTPGPDAWSQAKERMSGRCLFAAKLADGTRYVGIGCADLKPSDLVIMHRKKVLEDWWAPSYSGLIIRTGSDGISRLIGDALLTDGESYWPKCGDNTHSVWDTPIWLA
jgi:hypothetical protein